MSDTSKGMSCHHLATVARPCGLNATILLKTGPRDAQSYAHITAQLLTHFHSFSYAIGIHLIFNLELNVCNFR
jgi:hypothetical protein